MVLAQYEGFSMGKRRAGRGSKYSDEFKRRLVAESRADGVSVPMVAKKHGVPDSRIYAWRDDARFKPGGLEEDAAFVPVELENSDGDVAPALPEVQLTIPPTGPSQIEITLENGRKLRVSNGVDAGFVLELARGLTA
jgi:transposase